MMKKLIIVVLAVSILYGCETVDAVISDAKELQANVVEKVEEIKVGIDNVVTEAQGAYDSLMEKKKQLEDMVNQINEAVEAVNQLLGKTNTSEAETEDLQATIAELRSALDDAESALNEVDAAEAERAETEASTEAEVTE